MRKLSVVAILLAALSASVTSARPSGLVTCVDDVDDQLPPIFRLPDFGAQTAPRFVPPSAGNRGPSSAPGVTTPLVAPTKPPATAPVRTRAQVLDDLFQKLGAATDPEEAKGLASRIERVWLQSGSDTADLLMSRAATVAATGKPNVALELLDKIVVVAPDWVEGWNKRATLRFTNNDDTGSMSDIAHVLALEPRHFGALNGLSMILQRHAMKTDALDVLRKVAIIYPHNDDVQKQIDALSLEVEGRPI